MKERSIEIDLVKAFAAFSVVAVHFVLNTQVSGMTYDRKSVVLFAVVRQLFIVCVPLFLITTGYLQINKRPTKGYFKNISQLLGIYFSISLIVGIYRILVLNDVLSMTEFIYQLFTFRLNSYAWYVEMFIGLYLFLPYINILLNQLTKKEIQVLIIIGIVVIGLPELINSIPFFYDRFGLPNYWGSIYPLVYIVIGFYFRKFYQTKLMREIVVGVTVFFVSLLLNLHYSNERFSNVIGYYGSVLVMIQSVSFFVVIFKCSHFIKWDFLKKMIIFISTSTLQIYLFSNMVDRTLYPYWNRHFPNNGYLSTILIIFINFFCSLTLTALYEIVRKNIKKIIRKVHSRYNIVEQNN